MRSSRPVRLLEGRDVELDHLQHRVRHPLGPNRVLVAHHLVQDRGHDLWTGESATSRSFIFARNQGGFANTFASSYEGNTSFDYCNGAADQASLVRISYR